MWSNDSSDIGSESEVIRAGYTVYKNLIHFNYKSDSALMNDLS